MPADMRAVFDVSSLVRLAEIPILCPTSSMMLPNSPNFDPFSSRLVSYNSLFASLMRPRSTSNCPAMERPTSLSFSSFVSMLYCPATALKAWVSSRTLSLAFLAPTSILPKLAAISLVFCERLLKSPPATFVMRSISRSPCVASRNLLSYWVVSNLNWVTTGLAISCSFF